MHLLAGVLYTCFSMRSAQTYVLYKTNVHAVMYLTVAIKYADLILRFCRPSDFAGINKCTMHVV